MYIALYQIILEHSSGIPYIIGFHKLNMKDMKIAFQEAFDSHQQESGWNFLKGY